MTENYQYPYEGTPESLKRVENHELPEVIQMLETELVNTTEMPPHKGVSRSEPLVDGNWYPNDEVPC